MSNDFSNLEMLLLENILDSIILPSTQWALHIGKRQEFIAIIHVIFDSDHIRIDKGIILKFENGLNKIVITLNGEIINHNVVLNTIDDLNRIISNLNEPKLCLYEECGRYVLNGTDLCDFCTSQTVLTSTSVDNPKSFVCTVCEKTFAKKYNLNVHLRIHSGERPYICSTCGKTYRTRSNLSTHMNSAHLEEKKHRCEMCEMSFVHPRMLRIHMRKHTGEKPYMCQICGKVFAKNIHLTVHTRMHTGEKPFGCEKCTKSFTTTGNLNTHRKSCLNLPP